MRLGDKSMAAHKWWRVRFTDSTVDSQNPNKYVYLAEVKFEDLTGTDLAVGGTAMSSSNFSADYDAAKAFDKSESGNGWSSAWSPSSNASINDWIGYEFPSPVDVKRVRIYPIGRLVPVNYRMKVEWSDNGSLWVSEVPFAFIASDSIVVGQYYEVIQPSLSVVRKPARTSLVPGYNLEPQRPPRRLWAKGGTWRWETQTTGSGTISGIVTIENIPGSRKVRLYRKHDGMLLRETWSAPNGAYSFPRIDPNWEYFVVAHDHLRVYNGVIQDMLTP